MKKFHLTKSYALINFDAININSQVELINSKSFDLVLRAFIRQLKIDKNDLTDRLKAVTSREILNLYKQLLIHDVKTAFKNVPNLNLSHRKDIYNFTEQLYDYWRSLTRFGLLKGSKTYDPQMKVNDLMNVSDHFNDIVISLYRNITQKLGGENFHIYRQLPAGINANMLHIKHKFTNNSEYRNIQNIPFITKIVTTPPFIINSKSNTRSGLFTKIENNPLKNLSININHYVAFPIKVGPLVAFVYIHRDFIHQGIALSNLFQFANYTDFKDRSPDLVYVYGIKESEYDCKYFYDDKEDILIGFVSRDDKNDYFGYLKKMLLTLHNVKMINYGHLPIHGAMVKIKLNDDSIKNVVIVGDSGAGKSETLEALRLIGNKQIKRMEVVFDDMGTFKINEHNKVVANGTETGAFVRLDDLDTGYAYQIMDRAMFLNPNKVNARVVVPISSYDFIMQNHKVDLFLYANNYNEDKTDITLFTNLDEALEVFKRGRRKAKGTTSEVGLVESYFANPFGPVQMQQQTNKLLDKFFNNLKDNNVIIGEIYTKLAVDGHESTGPLEAAKLLLNYLTGKE